jgi:carbamoyltransferase
MRRTGIPSVLNTSFNIHEKPIVCSPSDAVQTFLAGDLDAPALEDLRVTRT